MKRHTSTISKKSELYKIVRDIDSARQCLGLSRTMIDYLRRASECVSAHDIEHGHTPWCYERVDDMASLLCVNPRSVRNIEHRLADLGLIERKTMANGHRWAKRNRSTGEIEWVHGISLKPLIERRDELAALATRAADEERAYRKTRQKVHNLRARLKEALALASDMPGLAVLHAQTWAVHDAIPSRFERQKHGLEDLMRFTTKLTLTLEALLVAIEQTKTKQSPPRSDAVDNSSKTIEISDAAENLCRHKYNTIPIPLYSCNTEEPSFAEKIVDPEDRADAQSCLETDRKNSKTVHKPQKRAGGRKSIADDGPILTPKRLLELAPERWREALGEIKTTDWSVIGYVAAARRAELGVTGYAWDAGVQQMGERQAAICLAILDANRDHPTKPVRSVGGAFVAMTRRAKGGDLHLEPSIQWIAARKAGVKPRANGGGA